MFNTCRLAMQWAECVEPGLATLPPWEGGAGMALLGHRTVVCL